jgi:hypothetical protein
MRFCPRYIEVVIDGVKQWVCDPSIPVNDWTVLGFRIFLVGLGLLFILLAIRLFNRVRTKGITRDEFRAWWRKFIGLS